MNVCIVNCFDTYEQRVDLLREYFKERGNHVVVLSSDFKHIEKVRRTQPKEDYKFFTADPYKRNFSLDRILSHRQLSKKIFSYVREHINDIDALWVLVPPNSFVQDAAGIKKDHPRVKLVFDIIDMWPETMPIGKIKNIYPLKVWENIRDNNICIADYVITECQLYQNKLKGLVPQKRLYTLYLARKKKSLISNPNLPKDKISLCYLGSINNIIDIDEIAAIIGYFHRNKEVVFHIIGDGENKSILINRAQKCGAMVIDHGSAYDPSIKQQIFDNCHFGLNIYKKDVYIGLTMKSIDYFEAGLPVINNIKGDTWQLIEEYHAGVNWNGDEIAYTDQFRTNSRSLFNNEFTIEQFYNKMDKISLLNEGK